MLALTKDWDIKTDIIVIGSGFAGLATALTAHQGGASVLVLEKRSACGGNSIMSDGGMAVAASALQERYNIQDSPELMYRDMLQAGLHLNNHSLAQIVARDSNSILQWLIDDINVHFQNNLVPAGGHSVPRVCIPYNTSGTAIIKPLLQRVKALGIPIKTQTCLQQLLLANNGEVEGIEVYNRSCHRIETIYGKQGVILATGGFSGDVPFRMQQDARLTPDVSHTNRNETTAEALRAAMKIGANTLHLNWIQLSPWSSPHELRDKIASEFFYTVFPYGVVVHPQTGKRICNELGDRKTRADAILNVGQPCIGIADLRGTQISGHPVDQYLKQNVINCFESLKELAIANHLPWANLKATIERYNHYVISHQDPEFQKPFPPEAKPLQPPYYVIHLWPKVHYTMGGIQINAEACVIDTNHQPIPNLYAAGEVTGGIHGASRLGGCSSTECLVFGRIAGRNAALNKT